MTTTGFGGWYDGRFVMVSGGTSGIGLGLARGFAAAGARVLATGSSAARVAKARAAAPELAVEQLDVRDAEAAGARIGALDRLDVLVNCQGVARPDAEWQEETFLDVIDINLSSAMRLSRFAHPLLKASGGNVVNIASMLSYLADPLVPAYCASKAGIVGLTRAMAHRWGPDGVRVNAIAPGYHTTDMTRGLWQDGTDEARIANRAALGRWGTVEDLVGPALWLASDRAAFVTGAVIPVDGGYHTG